MAAESTMIINPERSSPFASLASGQSMLDDFPVR